MFAVLIFCELLELQPTVLWLHWKFKSLQWVVPKTSWFFKAWGFMRPDWQHRGTWWLWSSKFPQEVNPAKKKEGDLFSYGWLASPNTLRVTLHAHSRKLPKYVFLWAAGSTPWAHQEDKEPRLCWLSLNSREIARDAVGSARQHRTYNSACSVTKGTSEGHLRVI